MTLCAHVAHKWEAITLSQRDFAAFLEALDSPASANLALQRAFRRHAERVG